MEQQNFRPQNDQPAHPQSHWQPEPVADIAEETLQPAPSNTHRDPLTPIPVVRVLSPVGVEYAFLTISLFISAGALMTALLELVNGAFNFAALAFPVAALVVAAPVFAFLFLRLKRLELQNPQQKFDPSKRRWTQFTQIVAYVVTIFTLIGTVFSILSKVSGGGMPIGKTLLNALCILVVSGGVLTYYWLDEHRNRKG